VILGGHACRLTSWGNIEPYFPLELVTKEVYFVSVSRPNGRGVLEHSWNLRMYIYDHIDERLVRERVAEYRNQVQRRVAGELDEDTFRPLRLMNGLYLQRHAYMLRVAIPYGLMSSAQLRKLSFIADRYDRGYGHWTTRQNLQYNWLSLEDTPDILAHLADVGMHAMQTSGNCVRNITADPYAGVAPDEILDVRPYCELIRQYTTLHPEFMYLPRKFKLAFSGSAEDRAATMVHDIGVQAVRTAAGTPAWRIWVGGGLGRTPRVAEICRDDVPLDQLVGWIEAILRVYNLYGRRDNKYKARIKILVGELGIDAFRAAVEAAHDEIPVADRTTAPAVLARITERFRVETPPADVPAPLHEGRLAADPTFARWFERNVRPSRWPGHHLVHISVKHPGRAPGDMTSQQMEAVADLADRFNRGVIQAVYNQNLLFQYIRSDALSAVHDALAALGLATPNLGTIQDMICCPGLDYCSLANASSIPIARAIHDRYLDLDEAFDIGPLELKMSGCINACGHHHVGHIGILGISKKGEEWYQISLGGKAGTGLEDPARIGKIIGPSVSRDKVLDAVETLIDTYRATRTGTETFSDTVARLGVEPFQKAVYG
jgi:sulfite reductase (NADPH) hemoprotein beta-component